MEEHLFILFNKITLIFLVKKADIEQRLARFFYLSSFIFIL